MQAVRYSEIFLSFGLNYWEVRGVKKQEAVKGYDIWREIKYLASMAIAPWKKGGTYTQEIQDTIFPLVAVYFSLLYKYDAAQYLYHDRYHASRVFLDCWIDKAV